ncbi:hypothetical protein ACFW4M_20900 [Streptomyces sp. NPDC058794]|uniref:hypothetical protein n=1 Tax=Streptomyces sp. NPDC058794 TaxID=3346636 RepID=UPI0036A087DF
MLSGVISFCTASARSSASGQAPDGVDAVAFGPPLDERLALGGRLVQHRRRPGTVRLADVAGVDRRLHRDRHVLVTPSVG